MTTDIAIRTFIEFLVVVLLIFGFIHEKKVIAFEQKIKILIIYIYKKYKKSKIK